MRTYILKRLLLMIPTLFGISFILWLVVTSAPGEPGMRSAEEAQATTDSGGTESRRVFREQFNLDKPLFWNYYIDLEPRDVLALSLAAVDPTKPGWQRIEAEVELSDWGAYSVPALVAALDMARSDTERAVLLRRLAKNAKRTGATRAGRPFTEEEKALNREILAENLDIDRRLTLPASIDAASEPALVAEKVAAWKAWFAERRERWEWSFAERMRRRVFDTRFGKYWENLIRFDLGDSHVHREPVFQLILDRIPISISLAATSLVLAYLLSIPLGIWSAVHHRTKREQTVATGLFMLYSLPSFFVASLLLRYLAIDQPWSVIPVTGWQSPDTFRMTTWEHILDVLHHTAAPIFCMTYASLAGLSRYAKSGILNVIRSDYVRTARAKGLSERVVVLKHAVRNGIIPIVTLLGTTLPVLVGGSIVIESVFGIPGIGYLTWQSIGDRDYNVVIGLQLVVGILVMVGILVSDLLYAVVDPRISYQ